MLFTVIGIIIGVTLGYRAKTKTILFKVVVGTICTAISGGALFLLAASIFTISIAPQTVLARPDSMEIVASFNSLTFLWRTDDRLKNVVQYSYKSIDTFTDMKLHPVTENPKVRDLTYNVMVKTADNPEGAVLYQRTTKGEPPQQWVKRQLYEFNEQYSKKLAVFYNPLYDQQQREFDQLVREFLEPRCRAVGLRYDHAAFALP